MEHVEDLAVPHLQVLTELPHPPGLELHLQLQFGAVPGVLVVLLVGLLPYYAALGQLEVVVYPDDLNLLVHYNLIGCPN